MFIQNLDVTKIYGIYESNDTNDPDPPIINFRVIRVDQTNKTGDLLLGEEFVLVKQGSSSRFIF
jgi:hypothetical protein